jgi:hypothetical protein
MKAQNWRVVTNRANAQHSTGPKTADGKITSSRNATTHGLTSKQIVIPGEDPAAYDAHRHDMVAGLKPANAIELELVEELAANSWRLKRAHRIESAILSQIAAGAPDPDIAIAKAFLERPKELDRLVRYMTSIERAYWRVFNKLEVIQRARLEKEQQEAIEQGYRDVLKLDKPAQKQSDGFVLKSAEEPAPAAAVPAVLVAAAGQSLSYPAAAGTAAAS